MRRRAALLTLIGLLFIVAPTIVVARDDFGEPTPGRSVYDRVGVLSPSEISSLETRARAVRDAGALVVVYLQARDATEEETERDASDLMDAWDLQSAPGAHDGLVVFFNLQPDDPVHGRVALYAGERHFLGNLPQRELNRIIDREMVPLLRDGKLAAGIAAGLDAVARDLVSGPPPPPRPSILERSAVRATNGPTSLVNLLSAAAAMFLGWLVVKGFRGRRARRPVPIAATTRLPDTMSPAIVGALARGRVSDAQIEATILDLARRGALAIEPAGKRKVQLRLIDASIPRATFERALWVVLAQRADEAGIIAGPDLARLRSDWDGVKSALRDELLQRGWFDPSASQQRRPIYVATAISFLISAAALGLTIVAESPWGFIGFALLELVAIAGLLAAYAIPDTSLAGDEIIAPWRSYLAGIEASKRDRTLGADLDLDEAMPYAVATGTTGALNRRLKEASKRGYAPAWLGPSLRSDEWDGGFYPYWTAFHSSVAPSGDSSSGGGASSGGGGASGSF